MGWVEWLKQSFLELRKTLVVCFPRTVRLNCSERQTCHLNRVCETSRRNYSTMNTPSHSPSGEYSRSVVLGGGLLGLNPDSTT